MAVQKDLEFGTFKGAVVRHCKKCHNLVPLARFPKRKPGDYTRMQCMTCHEVQHSTGVVPAPPPPKQGEDEAGLDADFAFRDCIEEQKGSDPGMSWRMPLILLHEGHPERVESAVRGGVQRPGACLVQGCKEKCAPKAHGLCAKHKNVRNRCCCVIMM